MRPIHRRPPPEPPALPDAETTGELSDRELDVAFEQAEPDADQVVDADRIAQEVLTEPESVGDIAARPASPFATRTMADLLASQGDTERASRIRANLESEGDASDWDWGQTPGETAGRDDSAGKLETLEGWLANLRGGRT